MLRNLSAIALIYPHKTAIITLNFPYFVLLFSTLTGTAGTADETPAKTTVSGASCSAESAKLTCEPNSVTLEVPLCSVDDKTSEGFGPGQLHIGGNDPANQIDACAGYDSKLKIIKVFKIVIA